MFSDELRTRLASLRATADVRDASVFLKFQCFQYHVIRATNDLLAQAIRKESNASRIVYLVKHSKEETNHADWLAEDLATQGVDVSTLPTDTVAMNMVGTQYYYINNINPLALFGYMAFLEFFPIAIADVEKLEEIHGVAACRTIREHAVHDVDHGKYIAAVIDKMTEDEQRLVLESGIRTALHYASAVASFN